MHDGQVDRHSDFLYIFEGNIPLHILTMRGNYQLRVDLEDWDGNKSFANYQIFRIGSPLDIYWLEIAGYSGTAGKSKKQSHNGSTMMFHY